MKTDEEITQEIVGMCHQDGDHLIWDGKILRTGRPILTHEYNAHRDTINISPHIFLYEQRYGKVDVRYVDNACGIKRCINPDHQSPRTFEQRMRNYTVSEDGCWIWQGNVCKGNGYGYITLNKKTAFVHRLAYIQAFGEIPHGLYVCHKCNHKTCINPEHLYAGTHEDNMRDMADANSVKGEKNGKAILTSEKVLEIKRLIKGRQIVYRDIAARYGVTRQAVKDIALGRTWGWLTE